MSDTTLTALLGPGTASGTWALDPERSTLAFRSTSGWGLIKVKGRFTAASGQHLTVAEDGSATGDVVIEAASVTTGIRMRDKHLRSRGIFAAEHHPAITYTVTAVLPRTAGEARVSGTLEVAGTAQPLDLDVKVKESDDAGVTVALQRRRLTGPDRGVDFKKMGMTKMTTPIELTARFVRPT